LIWNNLNQGDVHPKLQQAHIFFVQWVMRMGSDATVIPITTPLLSTLVSILEDPNAVLNLRGFFYICIGLIAHRNPPLIRQRIDVLQFLFGASAREASSIQVSITECLSMIFPAVQNPSPEIANALLFLVQESITSTPNIAVKFAFAFPFSSVLAKAVSLAVLGQTGLTSDLQLNARYVLDPYYFRVTTQVSRTSFPEDFYAFPTFLEAVEGLAPHEGLHVVETLKFLRVVMLQEILGARVSFDHEAWRDRLDTAIEVDETFRTQISDALGQWATEKHIGLELYFDYLRRILGSEKEQIAVAVMYLLELVSLGGHEISRALGKDVNAIRELVFSHNELIREKSARLLGIVIGTSNDVEPMIRSLLQFSEGNVEKRHGATLAIASIFARRAIKGEVATLPREISTKFASDLSQIIISPNTNTIVLEAGLQAFSDLCIFGAGELFTSSDLNQIILRLQTLSRTTRHGSLQDLAVLTLGYLSFALNIPTDVLSVNKILEALYAVHEQKQVELLFSAGQALSCVAARWDSKAMTPFRDADVRISQTRAPSLTDRILTDILQGVRSPKHPLRKAASIWLLSLLQFCDELDEIKQNLGNIHAAFVSLLTDRDDFVQETASKGMALVYLRGDKKMQEDMIWNLVGSVTSEVRPPTSITGTLAPDTQIFNSLATDVGEVSTYKEICNLASDTGNPELIYRFLALSSHSALWQSRKGAAVGIGGLLDQFSMQDFLERNPNYAKRLVPKLYRLCRDPNPGVAKAMQDIWDAAFGKTASPLISSMFPEIMGELLHSMGDKAWRTRQASAKAMADLCSGVELTKLEPYLEEIWKMAFRVADDIKESVRTTGMTLSQQLTTSLIRSVSEKKAGQDVITRVMPFLLGNSGLNSSARGVQLFALQSIIKLCNESGPLLRPVIPDIIDQLLDALTSLEPQEVNYLGFHVDKNETEALDAARFKAVSSSPVTKALERCIDFADESNMKTLVPIVFNKMKRAAGLPTKV
jgi:proteasome component ECM29